MPIICFHSKTENKDLVSEEIKFAASQMISICFTQANRIIEFERKVLMSTLFV